MVSEQEQYILREDTRETLEIFVEKADLLRECLARYGVNMAWLSCKKGEDIWRTHITLQMILPTLRMFVQSGDDIAIYILDSTKSQNTILRSPGISDMPKWWREIVEQAHETIARTIECPAHFAHNGEPIVYHGETVIEEKGKNTVTIISHGEELTYRKIFDIYFYGNEVHINRKKRLIVKQWKVDQGLFQDILFACLFVICCIIEQVNNVAEACKNVLGSNSYTPEENALYNHPAWSVYLDMKSKENT
jgi:hypothetical protein